MGVLSIILGSLATLLMGLNVFQFISFRKFKAKYEAEAEKDKAEAEESKQSALERRLKAIEDLYEQQGETIDKLRKEILALSTEKFSNERRINQVEQENKILKEKVGQLEKELEAYKTIVKH